VGFAVDYTDEVHDRACIEHGGYHALEGIEIRLWSIFEKEKTKNSVVDFDDMLHLVVRRLRDEETYRHSFQKAFDHVLMDEAQDTNPVQWEFVNFLLAPEKLDFYVVGDMSQSIYAFNGAVPKILKDYSEGWRGVTPALYRIARNHRSLPNIVFLANKIQAKMIATIPLKMEVFRGNPEVKGILRLTKGCLPTDIAMSIASEIHRDNQLKKGHIPYKDNCVLIRSGIQLRDLEGAFVKYRIPYVVRGGKGLLQTEEIRDIMAYLRLVTNPKDFMALVRAVGMLKCGVGEVALEKIRKVANEKYEGDLVKGSSTVDKLTSFTSTVQQIQKFREHPVEALEQILAHTNYRKYISDKYSKKDKDKVKTKLENIDRFLDLVKGLNEEQNMSTEDLVFQLTLDRAREDDKEGMVTISTIHSAKGLEWPRVFMTNLYEGSLPHKFSMGSEDEIEEERRLFYVGCTRPQDQLILCVNGMVQNGPNSMTVRPSRFLLETGVISE
jgi:superfamily I DNA/RNA helicase